MTSHIDNIVSPCRTYAKHVGSLLRLLDSNSDDAVKVTNSPCTSVVATCIGIMQFLSANSSYALINMP
jgi:hypothetical protein